MDKNEYIFSDTRILRNFIKDNVADVQIPDEYALTPVLITDQWGVEIRDRVCSFYIFDGTGNSTLYKVFTPSDTCQIKPSINESMWVVDTVEKIKVVYCFRESLKVPTPSQA